MTTPAHTCPGCGHDDRVQAVPAVYLAGRDAVTRRERNADGDLRTVTRTVTTGLADALAPVPRPPSPVLGFLAVPALLVAAFAWTAGRLGAWYEDDPAGGAWPGQDPAAAPGSDDAFLGWTVALALAVAALALATALGRRLAFRRRTRGRARAEALWERGWYCHRCGTVHLEGVPGEDRAPLTLQRFRERVWTEGGYGALATVRRAVDPAR